MNFGEKLNYIRHLNKKTAKEVAEFIGVSLSSYRNYEGNNREPNFEKLIKIADYLECSVDYLLGRTDKVEINK